MQASLISRRPVKDSRGRTRKIVRRIGNEDALLAALQGAASGVDVRLVELAELDLLGQLKLITETDILIGGLPRPLPCAVWRSHVPSANAGTRKACW